MYLKCHRRFKDGKEHWYWSIAEKRRVSRGRVVDRHILYLGEINDSQREAWLKSIEAFDEHHQERRRLALFPSDRKIPDHAREFGVQVKLSQFRLHRPRQWGGCWAFCRLWEQLQLDEFWRGRLADSREGTSWYHVLMVLTAYRLMDPGSEWRLRREWFARSAMADFLGEDSSLVAKDTLYRCLDKLLLHKEALFGFLKQRWQDLFGATFEVLLYDLTSTYFESDPPFAEGGNCQGNCRLGESTQAAFCKALYAPGASVHGNQARRSTSETIPPEFEFPDDPSPPWRMDFADPVWSGTARSLSGRRRAFPCCIPHCVQ